MKTGAHLCLKCRSLVKLPRFAVYLAALAGSVPVSLGVLAFLVDCRAGEHSATDRQTTRAAEAVKEGAQALEELMNLAVSTFSARYHLANACVSSFREPEFFTLAPGEPCTPQLLHAMHELDRQMVMLAYRLEVVPVQSDTQQRFGNFQTNYWAQDPTGAQIGYRQRILDAIHGVRDFKGLRALKACGPKVGGTPDEQRCNETIAALKEKSLVHIGRQADATLCSVVRDVNRLRKAAYRAAFGDEAAKAASAKEPSAMGEIFRMLAGRAETSDVCEKKLKDTPILYRDW